MMLQLSQYLLEAYKHHKTILNVLIVVGQVEIVLNYNQKGLGIRRDFFILFFFFTQRMVKHRNSLLRKVVNVPHSWRSSQLGWVGPSAA